LNVGLTVRHSRLRVGLELELDLGPGFTDMVSDSCRSATAASVIA